MNLKEIGILIIVIGIFLSVTFIENNTYLVPALTVTIIGFFITVVGYIEDVKKTKEINDKLDMDIEAIIQPIITKYSNLNKEYKNHYAGQDYVNKRVELNKNLEKELGDKVPYFDSRQIKKIVIEFNKQQDKMN